MVTFFKNVLRALFCTIFLGSLSPAISTAQVNQQAFDEVLELATLIDALEFARHFSRTQDSVNAVDCSLDWNDYQKKLKQFKDEKSNADYAQQSNDAEKAYHRCFDNAINYNTAYQKFSSAEFGYGVYSYANAVSRVIPIVPRLGPDFFTLSQAGREYRYDKLIDELIQQIEPLAAVCNCRTAFVSSVFKDVVKVRNGQISPLFEGDILFLFDKIITSKQSRARLTIYDRLEDGNRGPTVINVGSDSEIEIRKFEISFTDGPKREGLLDLIRGTIRAVTKNWGARSIFAVRTGTSLCGIRGTDVEIHYDPQTDFVYYRLYEGDVIIDTPRRQMSLPAGMEMTVSYGSPSEPMPLRSPDERMIQ